MIKLIILSLVGRDKIKNPNALFRLVKSYLILYMLALPAGKIMAQSSDINMETGMIDEAELLFNPVEEPVVSYTATATILPAKSQLLPIEVK